MGGRSNLPFCLLTHGNRMRKVFFREGKSLSVPFALLILCAVSFGLFIPTLGFYWDDWPVILTGRMQGTEGYLQFYQYDRPVSAWTYILTFPLFGGSPAAWHIFTLLLRWLTAVALWWVMIRLWPEHRREAVWAAFLFAVYPVFTQQPISVAYSQHWICYLLYAVSLGCMVQAYRTPGRFYPLTALSMAASLLHMLTMEYFLGVELLRPIFLWVLFSRSGSVNLTIKQRVQKTLLAWLPYLGVLLAFIIWRMFILQFPGDDRNEPGMLSSLIASPISSLLLLAQMALQDVLHIVVSGWYPTLKPNIFDLGETFSWAALGASGLAGALAAGYLFLLPVHQKQNPENANTIQPGGYPLQFILIGGLMTIFGPLPAWLTERQVIVGAYSDRLALPAMFGAALLIAGLISYIIRGRAQQIIVVSLLLGLAVGSHFRTANDYRWAAIQQNRFFWQLHWRAPGLTPGTAVFAEAEVLPKTGLYSTAFAINLQYAAPSLSNQLPYWFFSISREFSHRMPELLSGASIEGGLRQFRFNGSSADGIFLYYEPANADCLRVLTPDDVHDPALSALAVQALPVSNLSRIQPAALAGSPLPDPTIFGKEPNRGWCYYFQKVDLARQLGDWHTVTNLAGEAEAKGFNLQNSSSNTPQEWIPFIEGYAQTNQWQKANELTSAVLDREPRMSARLCDLWQTFDGLPGAQESRDSWMNKLKCYAP